MALDLTRAAPASPNSDLKLADQRGQVDKPVFLVSSLSCKGTEAEPWHCISMGPEHLILSPLLRPEKTLRIILSLGGRHRDTNRQ